MTLWLPKHLSWLCGHCQRVRTDRAVDRDIKLENTLLDGSKRPLVKICDFGYSKHLRQDSLPKSKVGTPGYTGELRCAEVCCHSALRD